MDNKVILNKDIEIVIITCFGPNRDKRLIAAEIKDHVKKYLYENDSNIQKKIERMAKNGYLLHETLSNGKFLYCISNEMEFTFTHAPPEPLRKEMKLTATDIVSHSLQLQEAIRAWMDNLPEVDPAYSIIKNPEKSIITACEAHPLFHDLANHLPERDIFIFEKWQNYRDGLLRLQEHKQHLYNSLRDEILKCFSGQDLRFVFDSEHHLENYECYLNL